MEKEKKERFADQFNFNELFRIKGKKGLFILGSKVHKSGMVRMIGFLDHKKTAVVSESKLVPLSSISFKTELGFEDVGVSDVFSNLYEFFEETPEETPQLSDFIPNYDPNSFKEHNALTLIEWFNEIITKIEEINGNKGEDKKQD